MEPDPLIAPAPAVSGKKGYNKGYPKGAQIDDPTKQTSSICLNLVVCVLCLVCVTASVYNGWRDTAMEVRLSILEERLASLEGDSVKNVDVLVERFRREVDSRFKQRVTREVASARILSEGFIRTTRDAPECICPAGKQSFVCTKNSPVRLEKRKVT